jgi:hypothetical protein
MIFSSISEFRFNTRTTKGQSYEDFYIKLEPFPSNIFFVQSASSDAGIALSEASFRLISGKHPPAIVFGPPETADFKGRSATRDFVALAENGRRSLHDDRAVARTVPGASPTIRTRRTTTSTRTSSRSAQHSTIIFSKFSLSG